MVDEKEQSPEVKKIMKWAVPIGVTILILLFLPIQIIGAGQRGVVFNIFSGVEERIMGEGVNWKIPIVEQVTVFDVRVQKDTSTSSAASRDMQIVTTEVAVNYHLDASKVQWLFQQIGPNYKDRIIMPAVQEAIKANTALYPAEEIITKRPELRTKIYEMLDVRLKPYYITLDAMSITNIDFTEEYNKAIEQKQVAEQNAKKADYDLTRVKLEAQQQLAVKQVEAEALRLQKEQVTPDLIQLRQVEVQMAMAQKWNGVMPVNYMTMGNAMPLIQMPAFSGEAK